MTRAGDNRNSHDREKKEGIKTPIGGMGKGYTASLRVAGSSAGAREVKATIEAGVECKEAARCSDGTREGNQLRSPVTPRQGGRNVERGVTSS